MHAASDRLRTTTFYGNETGKLLVGSDTLSFDCRRIHPAITNAVRALASLFTQ